MDVLQSDRVRQAAKKPGYKHRAFVLQKKAGGSAIPPSPLPRQTQYRPVILRIPEFVSLLDLFLLQGSTTRDSETNSTGI